MSLTFQTGGLAEFAASLEEEVESQKALLNWDDLTIGDIFCLEGNRDILYKKVTRLMYLDLEDVDRTYIPFTKTKNKFIELVGSLIPRKI